MLAMRCGPDWRQKAGGLWLDPGPVVMAAEALVGFRACPACDGAKGVEEGADEEVLVEVW